MNSQYLANRFVYICLVFAIGILLMYGYDAFRSEITKQETKESPNKISQVLQMGYRISENESILYSIMFSKYSQKYDIDWRIYPAIISVESDWDPSAISDSGAIGTMQVMEPTFKEYCSKLKIPYQENRTIHNDVLNLTVGLEYISQAVKKRGLEKGVKSYIGGHGFSDSNVDCKNYYLKFKSEYAKIKELSNGLTVK